MKPVDVGGKRHLITIQTQSAVRDSHGGNTPAWTTVAVVHGSIKTLSGRQLALAAASTITSTSTHEVRIRWRPGVTPNCRLRFGAIAFDCMASAEFDTLTSAEFDAMVSSNFGGSKPRYFAINAVNDVEERGREIILTVTEQVA